MSELERYDSKAILVCPKCGRENTVESHNVTFGYDKVGYRGECAGSEVSGYHSEERIFVRCSCCSYLIQKYLPLITNIEAEASLHIK